MSDQKRAVDRYARENSTGGIVAWGHAQPIAGAITAISNLPATGTVVSERGGNRGSQNVLTACFAHSRTIVDNLIVCELGFFSHKK